MWTTPSRDGVRGVRTPSLPYPYLLTYPLWCVALAIPILTPYITP